MKYIADLHIHSPFSRATSKASNLAGLHAWARIKGINLIGTGDFTHPAWFAQLKELLEPAEPGLFRLKDEGVPPGLDGVSPEAIEVRFLLTAEISSIYKRHDRVRKVHNILFAPDLEAAERINATLAGIGNIESDGRPILGLDSRNLLEILLEKAPEGFLVPAHIWTPWFSMFGSKSGFDTVEECFGDLSHHIFALETGLSSDPAMNRMVSALDRYTLISNSDCHSPSKLGREANLFDTGFDYFSLRQALKEPANGFQGTIEFFPEEGKYHWDGHRKCHVCLDPLATRELDALCPQCGKPLTVGVSHRVMELADRTTPVYGRAEPGFRSLVPLPEILGEIIGQGPNTKGVLKQYARVINRLGSEFNLFLHTPDEDIKAFSPILAEAIARLRRNQVIRTPGYDGEFGVIHLFEEGELDQLAGQASLFGDTVRRKKRKPIAKAQPLPAMAKAPQAAPLTTVGPNPEQLEAIDSEEAKILVSAGPGTGKTYTLINRLARRILEGAAPAATTWAITFTNKAAEQMQERLTKELGRQAEKVFVGTFHRFCLDWLKQAGQEVTVCGHDERLILLKHLNPDINKNELRQLDQQVSDYFEAVAASLEETIAAPAITAYLERLERQGMIDIDAAIPWLVRRLRQDKELARAVEARVGHLYIDEFQDLNQGQYELILLLARHATIFAIGDPDQAIYGFRGSNLKFFFDFANHQLPSPTRSIALTRNYRSAPLILEAAQAVIAHNPRPERALFHPQLTAQGEIELYRAPTPEAEAEFMVKRIEEVMGGISHFSMHSGRGGEGGTDLSFGDIAILYRLNSQAEAIVTALARRGIPFQQVGVKPFYRTPPLAPLYSWIRIASGQASLAEHLELLANLKGIGSTTLARLEERAREERQTDLFAMALSMELNAPSAERIVQQQEMIHTLQQQAEKVGVASALGPCLTFHGISQDEASRFLELAGIFGKDLAKFSSYLYENREGTVYDEQAEAVALMTFHGAKGLEFPVVFLAGLEEGAIPHNQGGRPCDVEEERRLFYVALTRAGQRLILSQATTRRIFGRKEIRHPSPLMAEIPKKMLTVLTKEKPKKRKKEVEQLRLF